MGVDPAPRPSPTDASSSDDESAPAGPRRGGGGGMPGTRWRQGYPYCEPMMDAATPPPRYHPAVVPGAGLHAMPHPYGVPRAPTPPGGGRASDLCSELAATACAAPPAGSPRVVSVGACVATAAACVVFTLLLMGAVVVTRWLETRSEGGTHPPAHQRGHADDATPWPPPPPAGVASLAKPGPAGVSPHALGEDEERRSHAAHVVPTVALHAVFHAARREGGAVMYPESGGLPGTLGGRGALTLTVTCAAPAGGGDVVVFPGGGGATAPSPPSSSEAVAAAGVVVRLDRDATDGGVYLEVTTTASTMASAACAVYYVVRAS